MPDPDAPRHPREICHRTQTRIQRCVRRVHFPLLKTIDEYNFTFQTAGRLYLLGSFLGPEFVMHGACLVLSGVSGTGTATPRAPPSHHTATARQSAVAP